MSSTGFYTDPMRVGIYIDVEWGDIIQKCNISLPQYPKHLPKSTPLFQSGSAATTNSNFYQRVISFAKEMISKENIKVKKMCDVGCATGRLLYEFSKNFPETQEFFGVEPSGTFVNLAKKILIEDDTSYWVPFPDSTVKETYIQLTNQFFSHLELQTEIRKRFDIFLGVGESIPRPKEYFEILFCLNVLDRHPNPPQFVSRISEFLKKDGLIFLATPLDWNKDFTQPEFWVEDIQSYFKEDNKWNILESRDMEYPFRYSGRKIIHFISQVICVKKK